MDALQYACPAIQTRTDRARSRRVFICLALAMASAPWTVGFALDEMTWLGILSPAGWERVLMVSVAGQALALGMWLGICAKMALEEGGLLEVEQVGVPLVLLVLVVWGIVDLLTAAAGCAYRVVGA